MVDIIQLLPDSIANQIAAGEVIQRPASVVKELLENAVDAKASEIKLIVKDAGKTLVQVIDNGIGMSDTDARMCLERHATSKIRNSDDLFAIRTMGFRGEAMASIASVAQLWIKTRTKGTETGTEILAEGSRVKSQEICQCPVGASVSVKNLFFNVPARRKFLKSDAVEMRHITDEFERVALSCPDISFSFHHNGHELFNLPAANLRQRIIGIFGSGFNEKLVPVEEKTEIVSIKGFIGKPETARKTRGEQFFFVNGRFIKNSYLHHAVTAAFEGLIPKDSHPSYFIYLDLSPEEIDINIHPTKTEIKFADEKSIYAILRSVVKRSLGMYNVAPSLDFEMETAFDIPPPARGQAVGAPGITVDPDFNPFKPQEIKTHDQSWGKGKSFNRFQQDSWEQVYEVLGDKKPEAPASLPAESVEEVEVFHSYQVDRAFILCLTSLGAFIFHQHRLNVKLLYEVFLAQLQSQTARTQQMLFPITIDLPPKKAQTLTPELETLRKAGIDIGHFGGESFVVQGMPGGCENVQVLELIEGFVEDLQENRPDESRHVDEKVARSLARNAAVKGGQQLKEEEMIDMIDRLFKLPDPQYDPFGKLIFLRLNHALLKQLF